MTRLCLDTSAYSHFKRGDARVVRFIDEARELFVPSIVLGELRAGFLLGSRAEHNQSELGTFLAHSAVTVLEVDSDAAWIYAELIVDLRRAGTPLPTNDIWIAALALREGATILTFDEHFAAIHRAGTLILSAGESR